jgi:hypothetical protein
MPQNEKKRTCSDCRHKPVCPFPPRIREALHGVIAIMVGGVSPAYEEMAEVMAKYCVHFDGWEKDNDG